MANIYYYIGIIAVFGALISFVQWVISLPLVEDYDDTEYPNEEDE